MKLINSSLDEGTQYGEIEVEIEETGTTADEANTDPERSEQLYTYTFIQTIMLILWIAVRRQRMNVIRLLQNTEVGRLFRFAANDANEDDDDDDFNPRWRRRRRPKPDLARFPKVPSEEGTQLMNSGEFGSNEAQTVTAADVHNIGKKKKLALRILDRELAVESPAKRRLNNRLMAQVRIEALFCTIYTYNRIGHDSFFQCRHDHSLRPACLLRSVLRRWQLLFFCE